MTLSTLPLSYCSNVHPGLTVEAILQGLRDYTVPLKARAGELAAGLWLAQPVVDELIHRPAALEQLAMTLHEGELACYTLNAFPYGNFHDVRVKEQVYLPDWTSQSRLDYTRNCARVLARLLPDDGTTGSISTVPLGFKGFEHPADFLDRCSDRLIEVARELHQLREETGRLIRLAIEPEPFCVLETTGESLAFFDRLRARAADQSRLEVVREHIGLCYDVCHQSVEFEDVVDSIRRLTASDIRIAKVHITCAIRLEHPMRNDAGRTMLAQFVEPRYLHQTIGRTSDGRLLRAVDLTRDLALSPADGFEAADEWRIHFHVPVNAESLGPLGTTRPDLRRALAAVAVLPDAPHLEVETYTWHVLPDGSKPELVEGLAGEMLATRQLLDELSCSES